MTEWDGIVTFDMTENTQIYVTIFLDQKPSASNKYSSGGASVCNAFRGVTILEIKLPI